MIMLSSIQIHGINIGCKRRILYTDNFRDASDTINCIQLLGVLQGINNVLRFLLDKTRDSEINMEQDCLFSSFLLNLTGNNQYEQNNNDLREGEYQFMLAVLCVKLENIFSFISRKGCLLFRSHWSYFRHTPFMFFPLYRGPVTCCSQYSGVYFYTSTLSANKGTVCYPHLSSRIISILLG